MLDVIFRDRKSRIPRIWSNDELKKIAALYEGDIANVSGWEDKDKEGRCYSDYFENKSSYTITNYVSEARGFQGKENEIFLDLTEDIPKDLIGKYDVVFNHTVLEHIFDIHKAFENICLLSSDTVILVVPFLQPMHADYGDFWRFTPSCLQRLFEQQGMSVIYSSFNNPINASVYIFCIATKNPEKWKEKIKSNLDDNNKVQILTKPFLNDKQTPMVGANAIFNIGYWLALKYSKFRSFLSKLIKSN